MGRSQSSWKAVVALRASAVWFEVCCRLCAVIIAAVFLSGPSASAQSDPENPEASEAWLTSRRISRTQRFFVTGAASADAVHLASWAEEVAEKVAEELGGDIFFRRGEPLHIAVRTDEDQPGGRVVRAQGYVDRRLGQKLILVNGDRVDQEEALEGLCWFLMNRYVMARQDGHQRQEQLGTVPYGLAVGLAQNIYPNLRARNNDRVVQMWREEQDLSFSSVIVLEELGENAAVSRAVAASVFAWMNSWDESGQRWDRLFTHLADGGLVSAEWLAEVSAGSLRELNQDWDLWLAGRQLVKGQWGITSAQDVMQLHRLLTVGPEVLSLAAREEVMESFSWEDLIMRRAEPWIPALATFLRLKVQGLGIGRSKGFQDVTAKYGDFLEELARRKPDGFFVRWFYHEVTDEELRGLLEEAHGAFVLLEARLEGRFPQ